MPRPGEEKRDAAAAGAAGRDRGPARRGPADPAGHSAGPGGDPIPTAAGARSRLHPGHRLYGRRCGDRAGGPRLLWPRHPQGQRGPGADQLFDAPPAYDSVRDVRDQVPRQIADLCCTTVDPASHGKRQRLLGPVLDPRQRILCARPRAPGGAGQDKPPGARRRVRPGSGAAGARSAAQRCRARIRRVCRAAQRGRIGHADRPAAPGPLPRARSHQPVARLLYPVVLEDRPTQSDAFPVAARRSPRAARNPRLCRGDAGHARAMAADDPRGVSRIPDKRGADFGDRPRRHPPPARRREGRTRDKRLVAARVARADGGARSPAGVKRLLMNGPSGRGIAGARPALICFLLGLLGALPLVALTPPFQVPDESQHFLRAYQLSELRMRAIVQDGETKAMLPSSLIELIESFLGTRAVLAPRRITAQPLQQTWMALDRPLEPGRRELVSLEYTTYPPSPYLPQAIAIAAGRWLGAGPLALLYIGRLANALVALIVLASAVRLMPVGRELTMLFGLLPMAIYEYASVSPDAAVITTAFLFAAVALRAQLRTRWTAGEVGMAMASGLVFCGQKPVYAPLLLIGLPAALMRGRVRHTLLVHAAIIAIVLGGTAAWMGLAPRSSAPPGTSVSGQAAFLAAHPLAYLEVLAGQFSDLRFLYWSGVGKLGWLKVYLPDFAYVLPLCGLLLGVLAQPRDGPRLPALAVAWHALLLAGACVLIITAAFLVWNNVGSATVEGVQGRYFLPLLALVAAMWCSIVRVPLSRRASLAALLMLVAVIIAEHATTVLTIVRAYHVF